MKLLGVILNYRTADMTLEAARAMAVALKNVADSRFVIVDNHSEDGSFTKLQAAVAKEPWRDLCEVVESPRNGGFGYGNNFAMRRNMESADPAEYFYLLNSDALPRPDAIENLLTFMDNHRYVGIAGSAIEGPDGEYHQTAFRYPSVFSEFEAQAGVGPVSRLLSDWIVALPKPERTMLVEWTAAVSMMLRRDMLTKVGLFDEGFFLYFEETDLCRRAAVAGFPTYYVCDSVVSHIGSASTGMKDPQRPMPLYWFEARSRYLRKHHGDKYLMSANLAWITGRTLRAVRRAIDRKPDHVTRPRMTRDFIKFNFNPKRLRSGE